MVEPEHGGRRGCSETHRDSRSSGTKDLPRAVGPRDRAIAERAGSALRARPLNRFACRRFGAPSPRRAPRRPLPYTRHGITPSSARGSGRSSDNIGSQHLAGHSGIWRPAVPPSLGAGGNSSSSHAGRQELGHTYASAHHTDRMVGRSSLVSGPWPHPCRRAPRARPRADGFPVRVSGREVLPGAQGLRTYALEDRGSMCAEAARWCLADR